MPKGRRDKNTTATNQSFESTLWAAADALRNNMDAAEYKHVVVGLIFLKYLSDAFEAKHEELLSQKGRGALFQTSSAGVADHSSSTASRNPLVANGVMKPSGNGMVFTQDYVFASLSTAAGVVLGRSSNGRVECKTSDGRTLREVQEAEAGV